LTSDPDFHRNGEPTMEWYLPVIWAGLIGVAVALYVILDGFDLGIGILFPAFQDGRHRDLMVNTVAPFWDGNETWLVLGGGGLLVAFPKAYAVLMPAMYLPVIRCCSRWYSAASPSSSAGSPAPARSGGTAPSGSARRWPPSSRA
jgi:hypothetical protein